MKKKNYLTFYFIISLLFSFCDTNTKGENAINKTKNYFVKSRKASNQSIVFNIKNNTFKEEKLNTIKIIEINNKHNNELFKLVRSNRNYLVNFMPGIVEEFGSTSEDINKKINTYIQYSDYLVFLIFFNGKLAGSVGLQSLNCQSEDSVDLLYWLGEEFSHKGIITNSIKVLLDAVFLKKNENILSKTQFRDKSRVNIILMWNPNDISEQNFRSKKLAERLKFKLLDKINGKWNYNSWCYSEKVDESLVYTMTKDRWQQLRNNQITNTRVA